MSMRTQLSAEAGYRQPRAARDQEGTVPDPVRLHGRQHWHGFLRRDGRVARLPTRDEGGASRSCRRAAEHFDNAAKAICWAVLFDMLDGRIARMTKTTTEIGVQFDSIADVLTFGIAPAVLAYAWGYGSALPEGSWAHKLGWFLSFMYLMCGAFRLARFNVQAARPRILAEGRRQS